MPKIKNRKLIFSRRNPDTENVENVGYMEIKDAGSGEGAAELYIYGDIVSEKYWSDNEVEPKEIAEYLGQIDTNAELTVYINSGGGDVFAGISIYNILKRHEGHKKGVVDGVAASIASIILMACDEIEVSRGAQIMIHKPMIYTYGNADELSKSIDILNRIQKQMVDIYMTHTLEGVEADKIDELINAETWMNAAEAAEVFDVNVDEGSGEEENDDEAVAAYIGFMKDCYKRIPKGIAAKDIPKDMKDIGKGTEEEATEEKIIKELTLYGV